MENRRNTRDPKLAGIIIGIPIAIEAHPKINIHNPNIVNIQRIIREIKIRGDDTIGPIHNPVIFPIIGQIDPSTKLQIKLVIGAVSIVKAQIMGINEIKIIQVNGHIQGLLIRSKTISTTMQTKTGIIVGYITQRENSMIHNRKHPHKEIRIGVINAKGRNPVEILQIRKHKKNPDTNIVKNTLHNIENIIIQTSQSTHIDSGEEVTITNIK
jgi:hypothetical protein